MRRKIPESRLAAWFQKRVAALDDRSCVYDRIESFISRGFLDIVFTLDGVTRFIELKTCAIPARKTTRLGVEIRPAQIVWHDAYCRASLEPSYLLIQAGGGLKAPRLGVMWPDLRPFIQDKECRITLLELEEIGFDGKWFFDPTSPEIPNSPSYCPAKDRVPVRPWRTDYGDDSEELPRKKR